MRHYNISQSDDLRSNPFCGNHVTFITDSRLEFQLQIKRSKKGIEIAYTDKPNEFYKVKK